MVAAQGAKVSAASTAVIGILNSDNSNNICQYKQPKVWVLCYVKLIAPVAQFVAV